MNEVRTETCILNIISVQHARKAKKCDRENATFNNIIVIVLVCFEVIMYNLLNCLPLLLMRGK